MKNEKVSKAQLEVWEWKDALYNEVKNMEIGQALKYLIKKSEKTVKALSLKNKPHYMKSIHLKAKAS
ncbi:MAG: hypothetical protein HY934_02960 [Candidatus Firestonebacteria bacterium]|nr:hypothetical protein [Candidatus Firestonebacteria bacterium]